MFEEFFHALYRLDKIIQDEIKKKNSITKKNEL
jgi:hypothetical protein